MMQDVAIKSYLQSPRMMGSHLMALSRPSRLPESSRIYAPGDPIALIDWKAYARTDQLLVREIRDEATARVRIYLDLSDTMQWPRQHLPGEVRASKAEVAQRCALALAHMHLRIGDLIELLIAPVPKAEGFGLVRLRSASEAQGLFDRVLVGDFHSAALLELVEPEEENLRPCDIAYWLSDGLWDMDWSKRLGLAKRFVMVQVLSSLEVDIAWAEAQVSYFDESGERREYQGQQLKAGDHYQKGINAWRQALAAKVNALGGHYFLALENTPITRWLSYIQTLT